jgi:hypothetical protein
MCTLIAGVEVLGPRTLVLGANRDESPERATSEPAVLIERPRVVGGRDLVAGGTWLAIREARFVTALMNRRPKVDLGETGEDPPRSRGLLCLDAAAAGPAIDAPHTIDPGSGDPHPAHLHAALALIGRARYAACTLVGLSVDEPSWVVLAEAGAATATRMLAPGWHVITHADVNDASEPRTAWLIERLRGFQPRGAAEALERIAELLRTHGDPERGIPGVCLHRDGFPTVSSSLIALGELDALGELGAVGPMGPRYLHASGPPCTTPYGDVSGLLG